MVFLQFRSWLLKTNWPKCRQVIAEKAIEDTALPDFVRCVGPHRINAKLVMALPSWRRNRRANRRIFQNFFPLKFLSLQESSIFRFLKYKNPMRAKPPLLIFWELIYVTMDFVPRDISTYIDICNDTFHLPYRQALFGWLYFFVVDAIPDR